MFQDTFTKEIFEFEGCTQPYRFHRPEHFENGKKYPLVLFLHGAGERGEENDAQLRIGIRTALSDPESPLHEAYIIAPQCPLEKQWVDVPWYEGCYDYTEVEETEYLKTANACVKNAIETLPVDSGRVFVMGISMGGYGSWDTLARHGDMYCGAFICCGSGSPAAAGIYKEKTIFTYHGALDDTVPCDGTRGTVKAIKDAGGKMITYREYPDLYHASWDRAYSEFADMKALFNS